MGWGALWSRDLEENAVNPEEAGTMLGQELVLSCTAISVQACARALTQGPIDALPRAGCEPALWEPAFSPMELGQYALPFRVMRSREKRVKQCALCLFKGRLVLLS